MSNICVFEDTELDDFRWKCPHHEPSDQMCYGGLVNGKCPFMDILEKERLKRRHK